MPEMMGFRPTESLEENILAEVERAGKNKAQVIKKRLEDLIFLKRMFEEGKVKVYKEKISVYEEVRLLEI